MALVHVLFQRIPVQHSVSAILCIRMFMGLLARMVNAMGRVLFAGRRHGDVTKDLTIFPPKSMIPPTHTSHNNILF